MATKLYNSLTEKPLVGFPSPLLVEKANAVRGKLVGAVQEKVGKRKRWQFIPTAEITKTRRHVVYVYLPASVLRPHEHEPRAKIARTTRPSPAAHAADHKGDVKRGHDGRSWRSEPDKNGVYHWKRVTKGAPTAAEAARRTNAARRELRTDPVLLAYQEKAAKKGGRVVVDLFRMAYEGQRDRGWKRQQAFENAVASLIGSVEGDRLPHWEFVGAPEVGTKIAKAGHPKAGKPGCKCEHCGKTIACTPVSHHSTGKPSKHYHPHHAHHHAKHHGG